VGAAALALVVLVAVQRDSAPATAPIGGPGVGQPAVSAPDISSMSPREQADRLYDRVMRLESAGKTDSAAFFAGMAVAAYEVVGPSNADLRYDYGRMAEVSGDLALARSQADAILAADPNHLLGLVLALRLALRENNESLASTLRTRLRAARDTEFARNLLEYDRHRAEIEAALLPENAKR
jgi:hypothetical protein